MTVDLTERDGQETPISLATHLESVAHQLLNKVADANDPESALQFLDLFNDVQKLVAEQAPKPATTTARKTTASTTSKEN